MPTNFDNPNISCHQQVMLAEKKAMQIFKFTKSELQGSPILRYVRPCGSSAFTSLFMTGLIRIRVEVVLVYIRAS